jgi:hypothetical protein
MTVALAACTGASATAPPPTPQIIYVTPNPTATPTPSPTPTPTDTPGPTDTPTPTAVPAAWILTASNVQYDSQTVIGDTIVITMTLKNSGNIANPGTYVSFPDLHTNADFQKCQPACEHQNVYSDVLLPGVQPHKSLKVTVTWIATKVGVDDWSLNIYDDPALASRGGTPIFSGTAQTTIQ